MREGSRIRKSPSLSFRFWTWTLPGWVASLSPELPILCYGGTLPLSASICSLLFCPKTSPSPFLFLGLVLGLPWSSWHPHSCNKHLLIHHKSCSEHYWILRLEVCPYGLWGWGRAMQGHVSAPHFQCLTMAQDPCCRACSGSRGYRTYLFLPLLFPYLPPHRRPH